MKEKEKKNKQKQTNHKDGTFPMIDYGNKREGIPKWQ
jgi:hypothetical protein